MGFNFFEGYGLTETAPVLTVTSPKKKPIAGLGGPAAARHRGQDRRARRDDGRGRGDRARPQRDGRLLAGRRRDRATRSATAGSTPAISGASTTTATCTWSGRSKDVIVDANGKNVYPDEIEDLYRDSPFIKELSVVGVPDGIGEQVACAVVVDLEHDTALSARRGRPRRSRSTSARSRPICRSGSGCAACTSGTGDLPKTAKRSIKRREVAAEIARLRRKNEESQGRAGRGGRGRSGRLAARHRRDRLGAPRAPTCSWAAGSASWASTA